MKTLRAFASLIGITTIGTGLALLQGLLVGPILRNHHTIPRLIHNAINRMMNITLTIKGQPTPGQQALIAANHLSYLDPTILGSVFRGQFIGKREVGSWPILGFLVKQFDPILIRRTKGDNTHSHFKVTQALNAGKSIIFFPEATTSNGQAVLKFKAGMFRVLFNQAVDRNNQPLTVTTDVKIQPVAIRLTSVNGQDATKDQTLRDIFAWHDDTPMLRHMWRCATQAHSMAIEMTILPILDPANFKTPEDLANAAHKAVSQVITPQ